MSRKKDNYLIPGIIALLIGVAAACMMFLDAITYDLVLTDVSFTGAQIGFGYKETIAGDIGVTVWKFNIMVVLAFLLPLAGGLVSLITRNGLISKAVSMGCFIVAAVFLFSLTAYLKIGGTEYSVEGAKLAVGPIIAAILSIVGAALCLFKGTVANFFDR